MNRVLQLAAVSVVALASSAARAQSALPAADPAAPSTQPTTPPVTAPTPAPSSQAPVTTPAPATDAPPPGPGPAPGPGEPDAHPHPHGGNGHGHHGRGHGPGPGHERAGEGAHDGGGHEQGGHQGRGRPYFGGLGYASVGLMTGGFSGMTTTLSKDNAFGGGYDTAPTGLVFGGGGGVLISRLWVGGKGFGLLVDTPNSIRGTAKLSGIGGGGEIGYAVVASPRWLVVPFVGVGGFGYSLSVTNTGNNPLPIYAGENIGRGGETKYTAGFMTGEVGLRVSRLIFFGNGGLMVGAEAGYLSALQRAAWESSSGTSAPESAELRGGYFRLVVGGGGFSHRGGHPEREKHPHD